MRYPELAVIFCLYFCIASAAGVDAQSRKPNVLLIAIDDLRTNLGCYGDPIAVTPNIDRLAKQALTFDSAYCQQAVCNPSRQSMMTGRRPDTIRVWNLKDHFRKTAPDAVTLPEYFKRHGYFAQSFGKIFHGIRGMNDPQSWSAPEEFDHADKIEDYGRPLDKNDPRKNRAKQEAAVRADNDDSDYTDGKVAQAAIEAMRRLAEKKEQPFFLAVGFRKPHLPFAAPARYWDLYEPKRILVPDESIPENAPSIALHDSVELRGYTDIPDKGTISAETARRLRHGYYAATSFVDEQVGKVIRELERLGLDRNTIVVLYSDHGFHLGEQGMWAKATNYEVAVRVPLIIKAPGKANSGRRSNALVELIDIYPTLVELCGLPSAPELDGTSLVPILAEPSVCVKDFALSQFPRPWELNKPPKNMGYSLRTKEWRYVEWVSMDSRGVLARELYHLRDRSMERRNLAADPAYAEQVRVMSRKLARLTAPH